MNPYAFNGAAHLQKTMRFAAEGGEVYVLDERPHNLFVRWTSDERDSGGVGAVRTRYVALWRRGYSIEYLQNPRPFTASRPCEELPDNPAARLVVGTMLLLHSSAV